MRPKVLAEDPEGLEAEAARDLAVVVGSLAAEEVDLAARSCRAEICGIRHQDQFLRKSRRAAQEQESWKLRRIPFQHYRVRRAPSVPDR